MSNYRKALAAVAGVFAVLGTVLADGSLSFEDAGAVAVAVVAAVGVYFAKNTPAA